MQASHSIMTRNPQENASLAEASQQTSVKAPAITTVSIFLAFSCVGTSLAPGKKAL